jgi:hypothetical protein
VNETHLPDLDYEAQHQLPIIPASLAFVSLSRQEQRADLAASMDLRPDRDSRYTRYSAIVYLLPAMNAREMRHIPFMQKADDRYRTVSYVRAERAQ